MPPKAKQADDIKPIYVVSGKEEFLKRQAIERIVDQVMAGGDKALAMSEYEGPSAELASVLDDLRTLPFLSPRRLVVVRDADKFITRYRGELEDYGQNPSPTGTLLMVCDSLPSNTRLYKLVSSIGEVVPCETPKGKGINDWLLARATQEYGLKLEPAAATLLRDLVGADLSLLDNELMKLSLYLNGRERVTVADVQASAGRHREEELWGILSAVGAGDAARALSLWEQVLQTDRAAEMRAIGGLRFKVKQLLDAKRAQEAGAPLKDLARMLMIWNDFSRVNAELSAFTTRQVETMLCELLEADVAAKSGGPSVQTSIESFIVNMCRNRRPRATG